MPSILILRYGKGKKESSYLMHWNSIKNGIRLHLGIISNGIGLTSYLRLLYQSLAEIYLSRQPSGLIKAAWLRRSTVNKDFIPFWSDIDLTLLIDDSRDALLKLKKSIEKSNPIQDIQYVSIRYFDSWLQTAGFRNRACKEWKQVFGPPNPLLPSKFSKREIIAFELAYEVHLLFKQLEGKISSFQSDPSRWNSVSIKKLMADLTKLKIYWETKDETVLNHPRNIYLLKEPITTENYGDFLRQQDIFWGELLRSLPFPINKFQVDSYIKSQDKNGSSLYIKVNNKYSFLIRDFSNIKDIINDYGDMFLTTTNFINLIKGVGIQEQNLLNELAIDHTSYYFKFNQQRLAHDLIGAFLDSHCKSSQLYFCFRNIKEFMEATSNTLPPDWEIINSTWSDKNDLLFDDDFLADLVSRHLDLLHGLG